MVLEEDEEQRTLTLGLSCGEKNFGDIWEKLVFPLSREISKIGKK